MCSFLFFFFNDTATTEIYTLSYTTLFRSMLIRAGASNRTMVAALGVNIRRLYTLVFGLGAALAGLAGLMAGPIYAVPPRLGEQRSEERRVGEEGRSRWSPHHLKKKKREKEERIDQEQP